MPAHIQRLSHLKVSSQSSQRCWRWHVWEIIWDGSSSRTSKWGFIAKFLSLTRRNTLRVTRREIKQPNGVSNKGYRSHTSVMLEVVGQRREGSRSERRDDFSFYFLSVCSSSASCSDSTMTTEPLNSKTGLNCGYPHSSSSLSSNLTWCDLTQWDADVGFEIWSQNF